MYVSLNEMTTICITMLQNYLLWRVKKKLPLEKKQITILIKKIKISLQYITWEIHFSHWQNTFIYVNVPSKYGLTSLSIVKYPCKQKPISQFFLKRVLFLPFIVI